MKALNDLTHALKEQRNKKGNEEIEALQKIDEILRNIPTKPTHPTTNPTRVSFDETCKPPQETQPAPRTQQPSPRVPEQTPPPRVGQLKTTTATIDKPMPNAKTRSSQAKQKLSEHIKTREMNRARIPNCHQLNIRHQHPTE